MRTLLKIVLGIVGLLLLLVGGFKFAISAPFFPDVIKTRFAPADGSTVVVLHNEERIRVGPETYIWVYVEGPGEPRKLMIDHNGRLKYQDDYWIYLSTDRAWIRTCKPIEEPPVGERVYRTNEERWPGKKASYYEHVGEFTRGEWEVEPLGEGQGGVAYTLRCDAYVNPGRGTVIRKNYPNATREQRESLLFAPRTADELTDEVEGETVTWEKLERVD